MAAIGRIRIGRLKITFVWKYRYAKKTKESLLDDHVTWNSWKIGLWFKKHRAVGSKDFKTPKKWKNNLVNSYMLGFDFLIFQGWVNWSKGAMELEIKDEK